MVEGLLAASGSTTTVVMPTFSGDWSDPATWKKPAVDPLAVGRVRAAMPRFDARLTATRGMGAVAECFRTHEAARRSGHPQVSFTALGPQADRIVALHALENRFGETSPLAVLDAMHSGIIFLGTDFRRCTAFHLAEYRARYPARKSVTRLVPTWDHAGANWRTVDDIALIEDDFPEIGAECLRRSSHRKRRIGAAECLSLPFHETVATAVSMMNARDNPDPQIVR